MITENKPPEDHINGEAIPEPLREAASPSGIDLKPRPEKPLRISKRAAGLLVLIGVAIAGLFAYGGLRRRHQQVVAAEGSPFKKVEPARPDDVQEAINPSPVTKPDLVPATSDDLSQSQNPELPKERIVVRRAPVAAAAPAPVRLSPVVHEQTPEERALSAAYMAEQQARLAPTSIRTASASMTSSVPAGFGPVIPPADNGATQIGAIARALTSRNSDQAGSASSAGVAGNGEYETQNSQQQKESFIDKARTGNTSDDYLKSIRTPPLSRFEIKAGWEIPAALEQGVNSDLPGELKALVMSNVYDTATGQYLLIPQGARLVGAYNSRVGYGQNGVQVVWRRVIFPDGSAIDLNGMEGLDAQGNAGLRDKVDHHYKQLFGFAVLTSMFDAALAVTQSRQQSVLVYPNATQETESAAGREVSQLGTQITRKNLNVQPTIRILAGYKFNVRVNRDILFEEPYTPAPATDDATRSARH